MDLRAAHASLVAALRGLRNPDGGWPYYHGRRSRLESTCWAMLATSEPVDATPLASWAGKDGLLVEPSTGQVNYAFNGLAAVASSANHDVPHAITTNAVRGLIDARGETVPQSSATRENASLQGWSWTKGTFTWVEPTSWCLLALKLWPGAKAVTDSRVAVGEEVMRDRACPGGGWNFGNGEVYGRGLPAHVPPTAIGVLALQDRRTDALVVDAVRFLDTHALAEGSTTALALSSLALSAVGRPSDQISTQLAAHVPAAIAFGNAATIAMAATALACASSGEPPRAFTLRTGRSS